MPRVTRFKIAAIGDLYRQLAYAPAGARRRQMEAAEELVSQIDSEQVYPQDFIIFRITGYRPDRVDPTIALVGEALVGDLVTLIQRLSRDLEVDPLTEGRTAVRLDQVARRLNVSTKTLQRYRQRGLVCHYLVFPDGVKRLACFEDALQRFVAQNRGQVDRAGAFSRVGGSALDHMIEDARQRHRAQGLSLSATARELAAKYGRAHETLRSILLGHDRRSTAPIFTEHGPLTPRDVRLIWRATRRGVPPGVLARRFGKTAPTIHRAINRGRREQLRKLDLSFVDLEALAATGTERPDDPRLTSGLGALTPRLDALVFLEQVRRVQPDDPALETALITALNLLKKRARSAIAGLPANPASGPLDAIETDLRWATLLKRRLVGLALPAALGAIEQFLGRPLAQQPSEEVLAAFSRAIGVASSAMDTINPDRGQRAAVIVRRLTDLALAASEAPRAAGRAATRHEPGSVVLDGPFDHLCPWQEWLELPARLRRLVPRLDERARDLLTARYGLAGDRPLTLVELARRTGGAAGSVARSLAGAQRELNNLSRSE